MKKNIRIALVILGLLVLAGAAAFVTLRLEPWLSADAAFKKAEINAAKGNYGKAFRYIKMASDKESGDAQYAWAAAKLSAIIRNSNAANFYAQRAWKDGRKERDVLIALVQYSFFQDTKQRLEYALSLINQMGDNVDKEDLRADMYEGFGQLDTAARLREAQFNRSPLPALATKLGQVYLKAGLDSAAFSFLQSCRGKQKLDDRGYAMLARLYVKKGNLKDAEICFKEATENNRSSEMLDYDHALFLTATKDFDRATSMFDSLIAKYPDNKSMETARISVFMAKGDFSGALGECEKSTAPIGLIAPLRARALVRLNRFAEAEAAYDSAVKHSTYLRIHLEFGNFLFQQLHKSDKAITIFQTVLKRYPNEQAANLGLATIALSAGDYAQARTRAQSILALKNPTPLVYLLLAQIDLAEGKPQEAMENCNKILAVAPGFEKALFLQALAYELLGKLDKADEILTSLMSSGDPDRRAMTRRTLVAIRMKEKKFPEALKLLDEIDPLKKKVELNRIRLEIYAMSGDLAKADETLLAIKASLPTSDYLFYQSRLRELRGDIPGAAEILETDLAAKSSAVRWALLRMKAGKYDGIMERLPLDSMHVADWMGLASAADQNKRFALSALFYKSALKLDESNAVVLNNYAYASMQTPGFNREEVLKAAKKAYLALSDKPEVLQTYAEALIKCEKPGECIKLLQDKPLQTKQNPNLLYQLGAAYEKTGDLRGAVSSYRMALAFPESAPDWPREVDRGDLAGKVEQLKAAIGKQ